MTAVTEMEILPASIAENLNDIQLLHDLEETLIVGTLLTVVDIVAALVKNIFAGFVKVTGCGRDTLKKIKSSVYGSYLEEKSYARYLLGVIPLAIPMLNIAYTDYNSNECTVRRKCQDGGVSFDVEEKYHQYSKRAVSTLENMSRQE